MTKFKVEFNADSEEKASYVKTLLTDILDAVKHTDSASVYNLKVKEIKDEDPSYFGIAIRESSNYRGITMSLFKSKFSYEEVKRMNMFYLDTNRTHSEEFNLNEAYRNPIVQKAIWNYFEPKEIRKVIDNAINRAREAATNEDKASEA